MSATLPDARDILSPTALNRLVRQLLDDTLPPVWIEGELSNLARPASGHLYFTLKDASAQVRCAMFRPRAQGLRFRPADGMHVRLHGRVGLYEPRGDYQLIADQMEEAGEGALQRALEALKRRLAGEGLFDTNRKRALPVFPRRLAVVTSPSGAAIRDVLTVIARRFPLLPVDVLPSPVQGAEAVPALRRQLGAAIASGRYDVILLTRGGGSLEDLWAFNDEALARDIAASTVPVVAAIGHEVDVTLAELAADLRAPTPSAAAEAIAPDRTALAHRFDQLQRRLQRDMERALSERSQRIDGLRLRLNTQAPQRRLLAIRDRNRELRDRLLRAVALKNERTRARLDTVSTRLRSREPTRRIDDLRAQMRHLRVLLLRNDHEHRHHARRRLAEAGRALHAVSPLRTLDRGYAILRDAKDRKLLTGVDRVRTTSGIVAEMKDGQVHLEIAAAKRIGPEPSSRS